MSRCTAPGMCPAAYSALASRFCVGRYQEASTTTRSGAVRWSSSHWVETRSGLTAMLAPVLEMGMSGERDPDAPVLLALLFDVRDQDGPDLARVGDVGAAAGLQI